MSGEAGGALLGVAVLVAAAPLVLGVAAAGAAGYGLIRGGIALSKHHAKKSEERAQQKQLFINNCSAELSTTYSRIRGISEQQQREYAAFAEELAKEMESMGMRLSEITRSGNDTAFIEKEIRKAHQTLTTQLTCRTAEARKKIVRESRQQLKQCTAELESELNRKSKLEIWVKQTAESLAMQKSLAAEVIRDAKSSLEVLRTIAESSSEPGVKRQYAAVAEQLKNAESSQEAGMYQLAFSGAKNVIMQCAVLTTAHVRDELETDMMVSEILVMLETLYGEMEKGRKVSFVNQTNNQPVEADLNQFSQGAYVRTMREIQTEIQSVTSGAKTVYELEEARRRAEEEIIPKAIHVMQTARTVMQQFYEREYALTIIAGHMKEQNYLVKWRAAAGGDPSQELVVNFIRESTGESISVSLSADANAGDIANMALSIHSFTNGVEASEAEREAFRRELMEALRASGFEGQIRCLGRPSQSSDKKEYLSKEETLNRKTRNII